MMRALAHARAHLAAFTNSRITYHRESVLKFALRDADEFRYTRDLVYAFGLFDYFAPVAPNASFKDCGSMLRRVERCL